MPTPPTRTFSSSSIVQLKLIQRLWTRFFIQTRKLLQPLDPYFYGDAASYAKAFQALSPLEDQRKPLCLTPLPSNEILNEFGMEAAYRLTQAVHTTPIPAGASLEFMTDDTVAEEHLLGPLRSVRECLFSGGENPPHDLPAERFSESFWDAQFKTLEEEIWIEFLLYMARSCFSQDESVALAIHAIAHLALGGGDHISQVYEGVPTVQNIQTMQRAWNERYAGQNSVEDWSHFQTSAQHCLQSVGVDSNRADGLIRNFSAYTLERSMNALLDANPEKARDSSEKHEEIIEAFFRDTNRLAQYEKDLGAALATKPAAWPVVLVMKSTLQTPLDLSSFSCKISYSNPTGISLGSLTESARYAHFAGIEAHDPQSAIAIARKRLNTFLGGLTYSLGKSPDSHISSEAFYQMNLKETWHWIGSGENRLHPSRLLEKNVLKEWSTSAAQLLNISEGNQLAMRVVEALRIYRNAKEAKDNQQRFTELWLLADMFLQNTNNPQNDLPLYQLVYASAASPKYGSSGYVAFQKKRWLKYKKDTEIFWEIRNHGAIHHKYPRWEERSLRLWTMKLEAAVTLVLRYCLNASFDAIPPKSPKECLKRLRTRFKGEGIF